MPWLHCEEHGSGGLEDARGIHWARQRPGESLRIARGRLRFDCRCDRCNCPLARGATAYLFLSYPRVTPYPDWDQRREYFGRTHDTWTFPSRTGLTRVRRPPRAPDPLPLGILLEVPYDDKDAAKALGAKWAPWLRRWYVPQGLDPQPFAPWSPNTPSAEQLPSSPEDLPPLGHLVPASRTGIRAAGARPDVSQGAAHSRSRSRRK